MTCISSSFFCNSDKFNVTFNCSLKVITFKIKIKNTLLTFCDNFRQKLYTF